MGVSLAEKQAMLSTVGVQNRIALSVHALAHSTSYRTIEIEAEAYWAAFPELIPSP